MPFMTRPPAYIPGASRFHTETENHSAMTTLHSRLRVTLAAIFIAAIIVCPLVLGMDQCPSWL